MKTDTELKRHVIAELTWSLDVHEAGIGVSVIDGVVSLTGQVASLAEKHAAEQAVQRVSGIKAIVIDLAVRLPELGERADIDIARAAQRTLAWNTVLPRDGIRPTVEKGCITLHGKVEWDFQRRAAEQEVRDLIGVTGVVNRITVEPAVSMGNVTQAIRSALARQADRDAGRIEVSIDGRQVILEGTVHSWLERLAAQDAAYCAPGVADVVNRLVVERAPEPQPG